MRHSFKLKKFITVGDYNNKHTPWGLRLTTAKGRELSKAIQEKNYSFLSTGTPIYWPTDGKSPGSTRFLCDQWNLLNIHRHTIKLRLNIGPFSSNINIKHIIKSQKTNTTSAHLKSNWDTYRQIMQGKVNLSVKLKEHEGIELETNNLLNLLQHAAKEAAPNNDPKRTTNNKSYEIKKLVAEKRRARSI